MKQKLTNGLNLVDNLNLLLKNKKKDTGNHKTVYFDLTDSRLIPYYFFVLYPFLEAGYQVCLKLNLKLIAGFYNADKKLLSYSNIKICMRAPKGNVIKFYDNKASAFANSGFYLNPKDLIDQKKNGIHFPVPMHPSVYLSGKHRLVFQLRNIEKKMRVFFSGNTYKAAYDNKDIREKFSMPNRYEVILTIESFLKSDELEIIKSRLQWEEINSHSFVRKLVLLKWEWSPSSSSNLDIRINNENWLSTLAAAEFFLACPGVITPQSHNVIEAMSVGCIPILSYKDFFHPALEHGYNCIYFRDEEDLLVQIRKVLQMDREEIKRMSRNVCTYYDTYLTSESVVKTTIEADREHWEVYFYNEVFY